jgi:hypothetical protein
VEDARIALNDVKQERVKAVAAPENSALTSDMPSASEHQKGHSHSHSRNMSALSTKVEPATPPKWQTFERDFQPTNTVPLANFKPTHLKRQRSDCESELIILYSSPWR